MHWEGGRRSQPASQLPAGYHWSILVLTAEAAWVLGEKRGSQSQLKVSVSPPPQHGEQRVCVVPTLSASFTSLGKFHSVQVVVGESCFSFGPAGS